MIDARIACGKVGAQRTHPLVHLGVGDERHGDLDAHLLHGLERVNRWVELDHSHFLAHFVQFVHDAVTQVSKPNQYDVIFHCGGDSHLPLLAPRAAVEKKTAEIGKSLCENDDARDGLGGFGDVQPGDLGADIEVQGQINARPVAAAPESF